MGFAVADICTVTVQTPPGRVPAAALPDVVAYLDENAVLIRRIALRYARRMTWTDVRDFVSGAKVGVMEAAHAYVAKAIPFPFEKFVFAYVIHGMRAVAREERRARGFVATTVADGQLIPRQRERGKFVVSGRTPRKRATRQIAQFHQWNVMLQAGQLTRSTRHTEDDDAVLDVPDVGALRTLEDAVERNEHGALLADLPLTTRQRAVMHGLLAGRTASAIARQAGVTSTTINDHRSRVIDTARRTLGYA